MAYQIHGCTTNNLTVRVKHQMAGQRSACASGDEHLPRLPRPDIRTLHSHRADSLSTPDRLGSAGASSQLSAAVSVGSALLGGAMAALDGKSGEVHVFRANAGPSKVWKLPASDGGEVSGASRDL